MSMVCYFATPTTKAKGKKILLRMGIKRYPQSTTKMVKGDNKRMFGQTNEKRNEQNPSKIRGNIEVLIWGL